MDFGTTALEDTLDHLADAGIAVSGAGRTLAGAREPAAVTVDGCTVALVSLTDNTPEFAAGPDSPGTAYVEFDLDSPETRRVVEGALVRAREHDPDLLVASLHWGPNMVEEPTEQFRAFARWLVDEGVDVVYGHSAHVFQGIERYRDGLVLYDTGDFVDDYAVDPRLRNDRGFLFEVTVAGTGDLRRLRLRPTEIRDRAVHVASDETVASGCATSRRRSARRSTGTATTSSSSSKPSDRSRSTSVRQRLSRRNPDEGRRGTYCMVETHWEDIRGAELRYDDHTWELTGDVDVAENGRLLGVTARQTDGVRHETARLYFGLEADGASLNPGNLGDQFDSIERRGDRQFLVVRKERRTYRYELRRVAYE
jgi:hypothetical protein